MIPEARLKIDEILACDKNRLDIFWFKDRSLADLDNLPSLDELATDIMESLQSALESFQQLTTKLGKWIYANPRTITIDKYQS